VTAPLLRVAAHNANDQKSAVAEAMNLADLILWSEAVPVNAPGWTLMTGGKGVITGWRDKVVARHIGSEWHQAHKASALIPTPARGSLVTRLELVDGGILATVNGHRQNGTGWPGSKRRQQWPKRRENWNAHDRMDRGLVADLVDEGYTVLLGADVNRIDMPRPHRDAIPLRDVGITQLWLIPGANGPAWTPTKGGGVPSLARGTSHRLQWRDLAPDLKEQA
jgi:hypothetical protein